MSRRHEQIPNLRRAGVLRPSSLKEIRVEEIDNKPFKNRLSLADVDELAYSIRNQGLLVPLLVRKKNRSNSEKKYELVSGHRRLAAILKLGLKNVDCIVVDGSDDKMNQYAIVENIQREDLSDYEKALAFRLLNQKYGMHYSEIGDSVGKSKQYVSNHIAMLGLEDDLQDRNDKERAASILRKLTEHHVRTLLRVKDPRSRLAIANFAVENSVNVRQLEKLVEIEIEPSNPLGSFKTSSISNPDRVEDPQYVVAVDCSAEKTTCRVFDLEKRETVSEYYFGPSNHHMIGVHEAATTISAGIHDSLNASKISASQVECIPVCMSSVHTPHDMTIMLRALTKLDVFGVIFVDRYVASFVSATNDGPGILVKTDLGGAGVFGRNWKRQVSKAGGWGYMIDPSGSAYGIGTEALRNLSRRLDDPEHSTPLAKYISDQFKIRNYRQLHEMVYARSLQMIDVAKLADAVFASAALGDEDAKRILTGTAKDLETLVSVVISRLCDNSSKLDVILSGPVLKPDRFVYRSLKESLKKDSRVKSVRFQDAEVLSGAIKIVTEGKFSHYRNQILTHLSNRLTVQE